MNLQASEKKITIEQLEQLKKDGEIVVDIRPESEFARGSFPGAVNFPMEKILGDYSILPKAEKLYFFCHTGTKSGNKRQNYCKGIDTANNYQGNHYACKITSK